MKVPATPYDLDAWTNPYTPRPPFRHLPPILARFFGYRAPNAKPQQPHPLLLWACAFIGGFLGISLLEGVYLNLPTLGGHKVPTIIASFGASAILSYNAIEAPLSQPRNLVFGHFFSALVGVCITKLFELLPYRDFDKIRWLAGSLSVGLASVVMSITKTVHPPAGATALMAATLPEVTVLGWWFLPIMLLGSMLMLVSALVINNVFRRYPVYWWTSADLKAIHDQRRGASASGDVEKASKTAQQSEAGMTKTREDEAEAEKLRHASQSEGDDASSLEQSQYLQQAREKLLATKEHQILIGRDSITVPDWLQADAWEIQILDTLQQRLRNGGMQANDAQDSPP
jgi:hypothetical protein